MRDIQHSKGIVYSSVLLGSLSLFGSGCTEATPSKTEPGAKVMHYDHPKHPSASTVEFASTTGLEYLPFPEGASSGHVNDSKKIGEAQWEISGVAYFPSKRSAQYVDWSVQDGKVVEIRVHED